MSQTSLHGGSLTVKPNNKKLLELREAHNLLQREVETAIGLPHLRLSTYERGKPIPLRVVADLATFYKVKPLTLIDSESLAINRNLFHFLAKIHDASVTYHAAGESI